MSTASRELSQTSEPLNWEEIGQIAGSDRCAIADRLRRWDDLEPELQNCITRSVTPDSQIECVIYPETPAELAAFVAYAAATGSGILPFGNGSKLSWGNPVAGPRIAISTRRMNRLIEHAVGDLTATVEAGMTLGELRDILGREGQFLGFDPAYPDTATIGGIVATGDSGSLRHRYRGVRDLLLGISFVRSDGKIAKAGGRVVKNVAGYDLMKLLTGSYGTLGIITQVTLRLYPRQDASDTVLLSGNADAIAAAAQTLLSSALTPIAVDLLSPELMEIAALGNEMGLAARFQGISESVRQQCDRLLEVGEKLTLQGRRLGENEADLWGQLKQQIWKGSPDERMICKIGVTPTAAAATLSQCRTPAMIHGGSGLGLVRFETATPERLRTLRQWCGDNGGFLSILEAPADLKKQIDVWGYTGNASDLMRRIKQQFDPEGILNNRRFVGGI